MSIEMKVWKFGNNVDTDAIVPARYLSTTDPRELASHVMEDTDNPAFKNHYASGKNSVEGDVVVAGFNFGSGSSREHAPIAIKAAGIKYVIAQSFARIFYRNAFNIGLTLIECPEAEKIQQGDNIEVLVNEGIIKNSRNGETYQFSPIPEFMQQLIAEGGVVEYRAKRMGYKKN